jgi:alpha-L-arabinofuranosidase
MHLKFVNASNMDQPLAINLAGTSGAHDAKLTSLHAATYEATNSINAPEAIHPVESAVSIPSGLWTYTVPALMIEILGVPLR